MFTGLVQGMATVIVAERVLDALNLQLEFPVFDSAIELGESIAIDGCCLTVVDINANRLAFQAGDETLAKTTLGNFRINSRVNYERAMRMSDRLGGHIVSGHVDCVGRVQSRLQHADWTDLRFEVPRQFLGQIVNKGSITVNGVSLTVVDVDETGFGVALIPHTLAVTNIGQLDVGDQVNLETDVIAKYVERLMQFRLAGETRN